ncbi:metallophosphoesterase family protein [Solicola gregarius]|uniref:Metallophosphatase family protein n=1 Tax=Solicola gregarius TaxID=2908642 RepID=A0AA46THK4_9ACTN|nr:metallophosphoesterase family protein [Solicola gregarius]UYM04984.1 metallophosphatase family protein [Solicola gregarius]
MRIAAIADIHGNLPALDAVLADIESAGVDLVVNLGDIVSGGVQPRETADRLIPLALPTVRGNHERQVLTLPVDRLGASDRLARESLSARHRTWLASLPLTSELAPGVVAFHGSPTNDTVYLLETVEPSGVRRATTDEVVERLGAYAATPLLLCGHTHLQRSMRLPTGALVGNPGSVGWPAYDDDRPYPHVMEAGTPHARYAVADDRDGTWQLSFRSVRYDWEHAASIAESNGRPDVANALLTGRV